MKSWVKIPLLMLALVPVCGFAETVSCVSLEYPPLIQKSASGKVEGLAVDVVTSVFSKIGQTVEVEVYPWARSLSLVKDGERDCIFTIFRSAEREQFLDFNKESIIPQLVYLYAKKGGTATFSGDWEAMKGHKFGTVIGINYGPVFEKAKPTLTIDEVKTLDQNFRKLVSGRTDFVPSNLYTASFTLGQPESKDYAGDVVKLPTLVDSVPSYIAFSKAKKLTALRDKFDVEFKKFLASGEYKKLLDKYKIESTPELTKFLRPS